MLFDDTAVSTIEVFDVSIKITARRNSEISRSPCLIPQTCNKDEVLDQFMKFQADCTGIGKDRADETLASVSSGYPVLSHTTLGLLTMPHWSAHCECFFMYQ